MTTENFKLYICGLASKNLIEKYQKILSLADEANEVLLFCGYSSFDIPIGHVFNTIKDLRSGQLFTSKLILKKVSQEFILPFDSIPKGHKTICNFQLVDNNGKGVVFDLPRISDWYESTKILELS